MQDMAIDLRLVSIIGGLDAVLKNGAAGACEGVRYDGGRDEVVRIQNDGVARRVVNKTLTIAIEVAYEVNIGVLRDRRFKP